MKRSGGRPVTAQIPSFGTMSARAAARTYAALLGHIPGTRLPGGARSRSGSTFGMVGTNGSAAYADIDTGVANALMRNRFSRDFTAIASLDDIVAEAYPPPTNPEDRSP